MKIKAGLLFLTVLPLLVGGCGLPRGMELSRRLIIEAVGVDLTDAGVRISLQTLDSFFGRPGEAGGDPQSSTKFCYYDGRSAAEALAQIPASAGLTPLYSQVKLIAFSAGAAQSVLQETLRYFVRETFLRPDVPIVVSAPPASDLIRADPGSGAGAASVWQETLREAAAGGRCVCRPLYRFLSLLEEPDGVACCPLAAMESTGTEGVSRPSIAGTVLFAGGRPALRLSREETQTLALLTEKPALCALTLADGNGNPFTISFSDVGVRIRINRSGEAYAAALRWRATYKIRMPSANGTAGENLSAQTLRILRSRTDALLRKLGDAGLDVLRLTRRAAQKYPAFSEADKPGVIQSVGTEFCLKSEEG